MSIISWLFKREPTLRIPVYHLAGLVDGSALTKPLGTTVKIADDLVQALRRKHVLGREQTFVTDQIGGASVIFYWSGLAVEALSFTSAAEARSTLPDLIEFAAADLAALDRGLMHFPR